MKQKKVHVAVFAAVVFALASLAALAARTGYGQSQSKEQAVVVEGNHLQPTAVVRERRAPEVSNSSASSEETRRAEPLRGRIAAALTIVPPCESLSRPLY